jgi:toxin ParE2
LKETVHYYNAHRAGPGDEFRDEAWDTIQRVKKFPETWHPLSESIRRCQMKRFPHALIYTASAGEILIIAVAHNRQAPEYWRSRTD